MDEPPMTPPKDEQPILQPAPEPQPARQLNNLIQAGEDARTKKKSRNLSKFLTFIIFLGLFFMTLGVIILANMFLNFTSFVNYYVVMSVLSLGAGLLIALIGKEIARTDSGYLGASSLTSAVTAALIYSYLKLTIILSQRLAELSAESGEASVSGAGLLGMFAVLGDPTITAILIIFFINIPSLVVFFKKEKRSYKALLFYLLAAIVFFILIFILERTILAAFIPSA